MTERDFQRAVLEAAWLYGWRVAHFRPARTSKGWRTPVEADGKGFPDLVLLRGERLIRELKVGKRELTREQVWWLKAFQEAGVDARCWRPDDWPEIETALR